MRSRPATWALALSGISLFYREGYFQQAIDANNWQTEYYTLLNPKNLPLEPVLNEKGEPLVCRVEIGMNQVAFQAWRANVGRVAVYLLDANRPENEQHFRDLTQRVYGGDSTTRIMQEVLLGIGGRAAAAGAGGAAVGLPHERRPRGLSHAGADPGEDGGRARASRRRSSQTQGRVHLHHAHARSRRGMTGSART